MTRRFFGLCLALLMALLLCTACNSQNKNPEKPVTTGFACDVDMTYQDMRVKGHLTRMSAGTLKMEFTEPATLNGMSMEWDGETISVKYAGLSFGVDPAAVPESARFLKITIKGGSYGNWECGFKKLTVTYNQYVAINYTDADLYFVEQFKSMDFLQDPHVVRYEIRDFASGQLAKDVSVNDVLYSTSNTGCLNTCKE